MYCFCIVISPLQSNLTDQVAHLSKLWDFCSVAETCRYSAAEKEQKTLCMWLTISPRYELRPKQLATSWNRFSSIIWEYCRMALVDIFHQLNICTFQLYCRNPKPAKICYLVGYNALQRRHDNTKLIYIWLLPKPVGTQGLLWTLLL